MDIPITFQMLVALGGIVLASIGLWFRIDGKFAKLDDKIADAKSEMDERINITRGDIAVHRLHAAETYQTKVDAREAVQELVIELRAFRVDFKTMLEGFDGRLREMEKAVVKAVHDGGRP